jgi:hypothetical protein
MKKILALFLLLNINIFSADDCGVNIYNVATGKLHEKFFAANHVHPKNKNIVSKRCLTIVERDEKNNIETNISGVNTFRVVASCEFKNGDQIFNRSTNEYEKADGYGYSLLAEYSYNMFAFEILCARNLERDF